jgi:hypothetical protein
MLEVWKYAKGFPVSRREALEAPGSFDELVRLVVADAQNIRFRIESGTDRGLTGCLQPVFNLDLPSTGDALFNGPWGYRAQYWSSAEGGLSANSRLLAALAPKLLAAISPDDPRLARTNVCTSLRAVSAKIWIREGSGIAEAPIELNVDRWVDAWREGVELARMGLTAPSHEKFEIKGAWLDAYGNEVVPSRKVGRHFDIHHYGYS